jgi:hypothetical protein
MTNFEDQLLSDLMTEHRAQLRQLPASRPAGAAGRGGRLRRARRPAWLATGAAALAAAIAAVVMAVSGAAPAFAVSRGADGTIRVSVSRLAGVAGANAALHGLHARIRVVPARPGCPAMSTLPHPRLAYHLWITIAAGRPRDGHHPVSVRVSGPHGIPAGATLLLAFSTRGGTSLGAGGLITGPVPRCVSLPAAPAGPGS